MVGRLNNILRCVWKRPVKVAPVERFIIRAKREWAFVYVDEYTGVFAATGSYGTYAYCWTHRGGRTLKQFLADLDFEYFMGKTRPDYKRFDFDKSIEGIKQRVIECRRDGSIDQAQAREAWGEIDDLGHTQHEGEFLSDMYQSAPIMLLYPDEYYEAAAMVPDGDSLGFWTVIWPEFLKAVKEKA